MDCLVRNANYKRVMHILEQLLRGRDVEGRFCHCQQCVNDIAALALNYLPPHYFTDLEKEAELGSPWVMVETAVQDAAERVVQIPHHARTRDDVRAKKK